MQADVVTIIQAWVLSLLVYPGVVFALLLGLVGEWITEWSWYALTPRLYRGRFRHHKFLQPLYDMLKRAGKRPALKVEVGTGEPANSALLRVGAVPLVAAAASILAVTLLPFPGSPITTALGPIGDLLTVLVLLSFYPISLVITNLAAGGWTALQGERIASRLLVGLFPLMASVTALAQVSAAKTTRLADLTAAPETGWQFLVRLLAGAALLLALPWWSGERWEGRRDGQSSGRLFHTVALAAFWCVLALPAAGDLRWGFVTYAAGSLFAYVAVRVIESRWAVARRDADAARLLWATALPAASVALFVSFAWGV